VGAYIGGQELWRENDMRNCVRGHASFHSNISIAIVYDLESVVF
jgi:hypothetical protein